MIGPAAGATFAANLTVIRAHYPEFVPLFFHGGRVYAYGEDADRLTAVAAAPLRGEWRGQPVVSIPDTDAEAALTLLVRAGCKIAVCEQRR